MIALLVGDATITNNHFLHPDTKQITLKFVIIVLLLIIELFEFQNFIKD